MPSIRQTVFTACLVTSSGVGALVAAQIPAEPTALEFPPLEFTPPMAEEFRHQLPSGVPVYLAPSHEFPLITVRFAFRGGAYLEPDDQAGLADALGSLMRRGGTTTVSAALLDERFDFLAANVSASVGPERSDASLNCLTSAFDEAFALFMDMLRNPGFDGDRLRVHQDQVVERLKQRNDSPMSVTMIRLRELAYGADHYLGRQPTQATIEAIDAENLGALHREIFHPGNLIISATGDFEVGPMRERLEAALAGWPKQLRAEDPPAPSGDIEPGLFHAAVNQEDLPQGTAITVIRTMKRDDPDAIPFQVMNHVLGGGGFTSRITNRVRSDEGLAYAASSFMQPQVYYPGIFATFFQSKNRTVALASKIIIEEIERIREEPVTPEELDTAKNAFIEQFPRRFSSKPTMLGILVNDEMTGRDPRHWQTYRDRVAGVTATDVTRVAKKYLDPNEMLMLIVGDWDEIYGGDLEGRASMNDFFDGNVTRLPTRDPLTLEPVR